MENFYEVIASNSIYAGIFFVAVGVVFLIGAIRKWDWLLKPNSHRAQRSLTRKIFGNRVFVFIQAITLILAGVFFALFF